MCKVHVRYKNISWPILLWSCPVNLFLMVKPRFSPALCCLKCPLQWGSSKRQPPQQGHLSVQFSSVAQSCPTLWPHESQYTRPPCPSPTRGVYSNSCPSSRWCHPAISSSVVPFSSCPQPLPASGSFPMSQLFAWGGQSIGVSASALVLPMNTQDWSPLGWTGWISFSTGAQSENSLTTP